MIYTQNLNEESANIYTHPHSAQLLIILAAFGELKANSHRHLNEQLFQRQCLGGSGWKMIAEKHPARTQNFRTHQFETKRRISQACMIFMPWILGIPPTFSGRFINFSPALRLQLYKKTFRSQFDSQANGLTVRY